MSVDFTKDNQKSNYQYLRDLIMIGMAEKQTPEALEFLEAMDNEKLSAIKDREIKIKNLESELEDATDSDDDEEVSYENQLDYGNGLNDSLKWSCGNIAIDSMMDVLAEKLTKYGPVKIEEALSIL